MQICVLFANSSVFVCVYMFLYVLYMFVCGSDCAWLCKFVYCLRMQVCLCVCVSLGFCVCMHIFFVFVFLICLCVRLFVKWLFGSCLCVIVCVRRPECVCVGGRVQ